MIEILFAVALLIFGFLLLIQGADLLIFGASALAKRVGVSELIVGLTVVAFGTSLPELIVSLVANSPESADLAIGNIIGSNIANILLILGIASFFHPLRVTRVTVWREILFSMAAGGLLALLVADEFLSEGFVGLDRIDGSVLIIFFALFLYYSFGSSRVSQTQADEEIEEHHNVSLANMFMRLGLGTIGLGLGGQLIVSNASTLASAIGVTGGIVGLSIVALGTSSPELAASITAVRKGKTDIAVGNVVGSNLFNTFWVLGISSLIRPLSFTNDLYFDVAYAGLAGVVFFGLMAFGRPRHALSRREGSFLLVLYVGYLVSLMVRGL